MLVSVSWYDDVCFQFLAGLMRSYRLTIFAPAPLWLSVRRELRNAAYLLPLAFFESEKTVEPNGLVC